MTVLNFGPVRVSRAESVKEKRIRRAKSSRARLAGHVDDLLAQHESYRQHIAEQTPKDAG